MILTHIISKCPSKENEVHIQKSIDDEIRTPRISGSVTYSVIETVDGFSPIEWEPSS